MKIIFTSAILIFTGCYVYGLYLDETTVDTVRIILAGGVISVAIMGIGLVLSTEDI